MFHPCRVVERREEAGSANRVVFCCKSPSGKEAEWFKEVMRETVHFFAGYRFWMQGAVPLAEDGRCFLCFFPLRD